MAWIYFVIMLNSVILVVALLAARPQYRKRRVTTRSPEFSVQENHVARGKPSLPPPEAPAMLVPSLAPSRSVKETIQEVKMVQVCFYIVGYLDDFHYL